jgi:adenosylcobinamide hydrolase
MRYYFDSDTLFIRGSFRAVSNDTTNGIRSVSTLLIHSVPPGRSHEDPERELGNVASGAGIDHDFLGLLTTVHTDQLCVLQYDFITVFITAGIRGSGQEEDNNPFDIIICSTEGLEDSALHELILVAAGAETEAILASGCGMPGTAVDAIIAACEGPVRYESAGKLTGAGRRVREAILRGIQEAIQRQNNPGIGSLDRPAFFIFSRFKGEHWVEWTPETCTYFPCHFAGQRCDFCYCPFYPCRDETLGQWVESSTGGRVWNCARCTLLHEPAVADYVKKFPGAVLNELKLLRGRLSVKKD